MNTKKEQDWSSQRLQRAVKEEVTKFFETVLDFSEVAVGDEKRYKALRSKVLRHGNDTIRRLNSLIDSDYDVEYKKLSHDIVKFSGAKRGEDK